MPRAAAGAPLRLSRIGRISLQSRQCSRVLACVDSAGWRAPFRSRRLVIWDMSVRLLMESPGEALVTKLWETLAEKGIGGWLEPWQKRRVGRATNEIKRHEALLHAQTQLDVDAIYRGEKTLLPNGELIPTPGVEIRAQPALAGDYDTRTAIAHIEQVAMRNAKADALRKEIALAKAALHAEEELKDDPGKPADAPLSEDWFLRWREYASNVSSDDFQQLWGKILAGEIKHPGRYSLRTLEFVKNTDHAEAQIIQKIFAAVVGNFIYKERDALQSAGITFGDMLFMEQLGLLTGASSVPGIKQTYRTTIDGAFLVNLRAHERIIQVTSEDQSKEFSLNNLCSLTRVGSEVLQLMALHSNENMLTAVAKVIKSQGFEVKIGRCKEVDGWALRVFDLAPL